MKKQHSAEIDILNRIMWLLEEGSVRHAAQNDTSFARYVETLYTQLGSKIHRMREISHSHAVR